MTIQRCFGRAAVETSPARGLLAEEAEVGAISVRFSGGNQAKVLVEQTEQAARRTAENYRAPVQLDPPRVRQRGSVVVVYDKAPKPRQEQAVSRCTGVRR